MVCSRQQGSPQTLPSSHRHLLELTLCTTLFSWGVRKPDLELQVLRKRGHNYKRASLYSFINEGCEAKKARPPNPSRGEGQLSGRGWKRWGKKAMLWGVRNGLGQGTQPGEDKAKTASCGRTTQHGRATRRKKNLRGWLRPDHARPSPSD